MSDLSSRLSALQRAAFLVTAVILVLAAAPAVVSADATPTPERPYRVYLPTIFKDNAPAQPVTVTFQQGVNGYAGALDTYISNYDPYATHGFDPILAVRWQRAQATDAEFSLLQFDLTSIPSTATIQSATLVLYATNRTNVGQIEVAAYGMLRAWQPNQANWYSPTVSSAWVVPGCNGINTDRQGLAADRVTITDLNVPVNMSMASLVQSWVRNPANNYGFALKPVGTTGSPSVRYELAGSLYPDTALRPKLTVTYILLPEPPPTVVVPTATPTRTATPTVSMPTATATTIPTPTATWTPSSSWWNTSYSYRRRLNVQTAQYYGVTSGYAVSLTLDTDQLVADGKLRADRRDWRIVAWNGWAWAELDRHVVGSAETWFALSRAIGADNDDNLYYVYYGNPSESSEPRADKSRIYAFYDDFDSYDASKWPWPTPTGIQLGHGVITVTAYNANGDIADSCPGSYDCMLSRQTFGLGYQVEERARHPDYVYGKNHDADQGFSDDGHTNEAKLRSYNAGQFQRVNRDGVVNVVVQCCAPADTDWHIFRVTRLDASSILFQIDNGPVEVSTTHLPLMSLPVHIRAYSAEPFEASRNVVDWIKVRPVVAAEPSVTWAREEHAQFEAMMWSGE